RGALGGVLVVDAAFRAEERYRLPVLRIAPFDAGAVGDVLDRVVRRRLMRDATVPGRACALGRVAAERARFGIVELYVELGIVFNRLAGFGIEPLGPVQVVHILCALDEASR